jgi:hypothetical protein
MVTKVGRPSADAVTSEIPKNIIDSQKITAGMKDDPSMEMTEKVSNMLDSQARMELSKISLLNTKKLRKDLEEEVGVDVSDSGTVKNKPALNLGSNITADDIVKIANTLDPEQREGFITRMLDQMQGRASNPLVAAFLSKPKPENPNAIQQTSLNDMIAAQMTMMQMQIMADKQANDNWKMRMEEEDRAHRRRIDELREVKGDIKPQSGESNPEVAALKVQIDILKDALNENKELMKTLAAGGNGRVDELNTKILELTRNSLENEKAAMEEKYAQLSRQVQDGNRVVGSISELTKRLSEQTGMPVQVGGMDTLTQTQEHEFRMEQLKLTAAREAKQDETGILEAQAKIESAKALKESAMLVATSVAGVLMGPKKDRSLENSSEKVKTLAGAIK